jgi:TetR/AcrR family transcriptional regulator, transcriptional repressor for nem operon
MKQAGLTVDGFYKHFNSRDDLVAEAVSSAPESWSRQVDAAASDGRPVAYEELVDNYLSEAHRDDPGAGCPVGALAEDIGRSSKQTRILVTRQIRHDIELFAATLNDRSDKDKRAPRSQAVLTYCALVGGMGVSRALRRRTAEESVASWNSRWRMLGSLLRQSDT